MTFGRRLAVATGMALAVWYFLDPLLYALIGV